MCEICFGNTFDMKPRCVNTCFQCSCLFSILRIEAIPKPVVVASELASICGICCLCGRTLEAFALLRLKHAKAVVS